MTTAIGAGNKIFKKIDRNSGIEVTLLGGADYNPDAIKFDIYPGHFVPTFQNVAGDFGMDDVGDARGIAWADYDGDNDLDLYVSNAGANLLYRNDGGAFAEVAGTALVNDSGPGTGIAWADYDNDGDLDLYLGIEPGNNRLYRNDGPTFAEDGFNAGVDDNQQAIDVAWADYDKDGFLDLYVSNGGGNPNRLYRNEGDGTFDEVGTTLGLNDTGVGRGTTWADYNGDGYPDLYITKTNGLNRLVRNDGDGTFTDVGAAAHIDDGFVSVGVAWADYDNDLDLDLMVVESDQQNRLFRNDGGVFTDVRGPSNIANSLTGVSPAWADYDNDGDQDVYVTNWGDRNLFHLNNADGTFAEIGNNQGVADTGTNRGASWGDYDSDGDLDLYVANVGSNRLYRNNGNANQWLQIELQGTASNASGIGAKLTANVGGQQQFREVSGGSGYLSQPSLAQEFGLGTATQIDQLTVVWPSGIVQTLDNLAANQVLSLVEASTIDVSIADLTSLYGQQITVPIQVSETTGTGIVSAEIFLCYDGDLLTPLSTDITGTLLDANWSIETNIEDGGQIDTYKIAMATGNAPLSGVGTLINVTFQIADTRVPASSELTLKHVLFNDGNPIYTATDGSLTILGTDGTISSLPATIIPRETVTVTVVDIDLDTDGAAGTDNVVVSIDNTSNGDTINLILNEGATAGTFSATYDTEFGTSAIVDARIQAKAGDAIVATYADALDGAGAGPTNRTATTNVIGGADGSVEITLVSQPGNPLYIQVTDADLNTSTSSAQTASVTVENTTTNDIFIVVLDEADDNDDVFFGSLPTTAGASTGTELGTIEDDIVTVTYDDVVTLVGDQQNRTDNNDVIFPWGDADDNDVLQAFDAAKILVHVLNGSPIDEQASNVDDETITSGINPFDASLVLQKRVGLIATFPVQDPTSENHPQGTASPKLVPQTRNLSLVAGDGYLSIHATERGDLISGDLTLQGINGRVEMGAELAEYLTASKTTDDGLRIVFAGAEAISGPGELLRIYGSAPGAIELSEAIFNNGHITGTASGLTTMATPTSFALHPNVPNPFNPETTIRFELPQAAEVKLEVFDILGQKVKTLVSDELPAGTHAAIWHGRNDAGNPVGNGVYLYRIQAGEFTQMRRMLLLK